MKVMIFNDTQNFNGSMEFINEKLKRDEKRFWDYNKYIPFLFEKIKLLEEFKDKNLQLIKTFFYEGRYNSNLINNFTWSCNKELGRLNKLINKEKNLLNLISQEKASHYLRSEINKHVNYIIEDLIKERDTLLKNKRKQERNFEGQKDMFKKLENNLIIDLKTTPLKQKKGEIYQKGVDVLLATDLVNLAHKNEYDVAIILSGDTDLIEAVKLIKSLGKQVIIISYHTPKDPLRSNISDLMNEGKFINLRGFTNEDIIAMSELRKKRESLV